MSRARLMIRARLRTAGFAIALAVSMTASPLHAAASAVTAAATVMAQAPDAAAYPAADVFADADAPTVVLQGQGLYRSHCANCHGRRLQGQALWSLRDRYYHQRAPAHDDSGHTWQHADRELLAITRSGQPPGMPGFAGVLADEQILAIIAFIKSRWSIGTRAAQAMLNPDFRGMPAAAADAAWTFPPNCSTPGTDTPGTGTTGTE